MILTFLKSSDQLFCRMPLAVDLSCCVPMIRFRLNIFGRNIIDILLCPHCMTSEVYDIIIDDAAFDHLAKAVVTKCLQC